MVLTGIVQADGTIVIKGAAHPLMAGDEVQIVVQSGGSSLEEVKQRLAEDRPMTPEQEAEYHRIWAEFDQVKLPEAAKLPEDYIDELDHYLYGTTKRREGK